MHRESIYVPMDDMWENLIIPSGTCFEILHKSTQIGYYIVDANGYLLQFFLKDSDKNESLEIFNHIVETDTVVGAYAGSFEPDFQSLALNRAKETTIDTILYRAMKYDPLTCPVEGLERRLASMDDYDAVLKFCLDKVGLQGEWMQPYYQDLLPRECVHLFELDGEIIGIGELRPSKSSPEFANLGMMVAKEWRRKKLGSYIMNQILILAKEKDLIGICSTTQENIGSQKAIIKAGLAPYHRILKINF